jgi:hypothetical protein
MTPLLQHQNAPRGVVLVVYCCHCQEAKKIPGAAVQVVCGLIPAQGILDLKRTGDKYLVEIKSMALMLVIALVLSRHRTSEKFFETSIYYF